jgi:hypothetical protein
MDTSPTAMFDEYRTFVILVDFVSSTTHKPQPSYFEFYTSLCSPPAQEH